MKQVKFYSSIFIVMLVLANHLSVKAQDWTFAVSAGSANTDFPKSVKTDAAGNVFIAGVFSTTATFGGSTNIVSLGSYDVFIAKYDAAGNFLWVRSGGSTTFDYIGGLDVDAAGNAYLLSTIAGTATFGATSLPNAFSNDIFLAKYDPSGNLVFLKEGGFMNDLAMAITVDGSGNIYAAGAFTGTGSFKGTPLSVKGSDDVLVIKYNSNGDFLWVRAAGGPQSDKVSGIATDAKGDVYIVGEFSDSITFGSTVVYSNGGSDLYLAKYTPSGNFVRAISAGGSANDGALSLAINTAGDVVMSGYFSGTVNFGASVLNSQGLKDVFISKYDTVGTHIWARGGGSSADDNGNSVAFDGAQNIYVTGDFRNTAQFDGSSLVSVGSADAFLVKYTPTGDRLWAIKAGGSLSDFGYGVTIGADDSLYLTGMFSNSLNLGSTVLTGSSMDIFLAKLSCVPPVITTQPQADTVCQFNHGIFSVGVSGSVVNYQWKKNGSENVGTNSATLAIKNAKPSDAANYSVVVTGQCGTANSNPSSLTVLPCKTNTTIRINRH